MRVLWLVNIPMPPVRARLGLPPVSYGGWLPAMLAALLARQSGTQIVCACRSWPAPEPFESDGVRYITLPRKPVVGRLRRVLSNWSTREDEMTLEAQMSGLVADVQPDLIHLHGTEQPHALSLLRVAAATPVLVTIQGPTSEYALHWTDGLSVRDKILDRASPEYIKGRGLAQSYRVSRAHGARELKALQLASDVSGRTDWDRNVVARANPKARYWHIDEILRPEFYDRTWTGPADGEPVLVAVTRADPIKGIDILLKAFASIRDRRPCRLRIVGGMVDTPLWPSLRRLERDLGLTGSVEWCGERGAVAIAEMLSVCSVAVSATRLDNSPNGVCEAMLVGAPVVASRTGGIPSLITNERDGLLFPVEDDQALASAVLRVLDDEQLARRLGAAAKQNAGARHDPSRVATRMLDVYSVLASSSHA